MSDHQLETFTREAGADIVPPDFDALVVTSKRRRRAKVAGSVAAAAAVVSALTIGIQQVYDNQVSPVRPVNPPHTTSPTVSPPTDLVRKDAATARAERIVNHPDATLTQLAVSPDDPDLRAAIWSYCKGRSCSAEQHAMTVTDDGFLTSHFIDLPRVAYPSLTALGSDAFFYSQGRRILQVVHADGLRDDVLITDAEEPVRADEVLVTEPYSQPNQYLGLNLATRVAHPIPLPQMGAESQRVQIWQQSEDRLWGLVHSGSRPTPVAVWSTDGGRIWTPHVLDGSPHFLFHPIVSADPATMAVVEGGDGATFLPFDRIHRSLDGGATWEIIEESPDDMAYIGTGYVRPDGSLLVNIIAWSDQRVNVPSRHPVGLYESDGLDWADLRPVQPGFPDSAEPGELLLPAAGLVGDAGQPALYARGALTLAYVSTDGGQSWSETPAR